MDYAEIKARNDAGANHLLVPAGEHHIVPPLEARFGIVPRTESFVIEGEGPSSRLIFPTEIVGVSKEAPGGTIEFRDIAFGKDEQQTTQGKLLEIGPGWFTIQVPPGLPPPTRKATSWWGRYAWCFSAHKRPRRQNQYGRYPFDYAEPVDEPNRIWRVLLSPKLRDAGLLLPFPIGFLVALKIKHGHGPWRLADQALVKMSNVTVTGAARGQISRCSIVDVDGLNIPRVARGHCLSTNAGGIHMQGGTDARIRRLFVQGCGDDPITVADNSKLTVEASTFVDNYHMGRSSAEAVVAIGDGNEMIRTGPWVYNSEEEDDA